MSQNIWDDLWGDTPEPEIAPKSFNAMKLALYFKDKFQLADWSGFGVTNVRALAGALSPWRTKTDADTIVTMMDAYLTDPTLRGKNPGWQDFLYRAEQIHAKLNPSLVKDKWDLLEEEWDAAHRDV